MEEIKSIRISELKDFKNHPFHVQQDMEMCALMKSIEDEGVIVPLLVRPKYNGVSLEIQSIEQKVRNSQQLLSYSSFYKNKGQYVV